MPSMALAIALVFFCAQSAVNAVALASQLKQKASERHSTSERQGVSITADAEVLLRQSDHAEVFKSKTQQKNSVPSLEGFLAGVTSAGSQLRNKLLHVGYAMGASKRLPDPTGLSLTDWAANSVPYIPVLSQKQDVKPLDYVLEKKLVLQDGLFLEFGVFRGDSINRIASHLPRGSKVFGFDSFKGLPENFQLTSGVVINKNVFDVHGHLPSVMPNVQLVQGWFNDTLPGFLRDRPNVPLSLLHIDSDLYSSAKFVLDTVSNRIRPGSIIVFDELINYPDYEQQELRALYEALSAGGALHDRRVEWIGSKCPARLMPSDRSEDWGPCCAVALRVVS